MGDSPALNSEPLNHSPASSLGGDAAETTILSERANGRNAVRAKTGEELPLRGFSRQKSSKMGVHHQ